MAGPTQKILRQAFQLTKGNKYFWWLGLFLVWVNLAKSLGLIFAVSVAGQGGGYFWPQQAKVEDGGKLWIGALLIFLVLAFTVMYFRSKAFLIWSVKELKDKNNLDLTLVKELAEPHTLNLMKIGLAFGITALMALLAFLSPLNYLMSHDYQARAAASGGMALVILVPILVILYFFSIFQPLLMALRGMSMGNSFRATVDLVRRTLPVLVRFSLVMLAWETIAIVLSGALALVTIIPFVLLIPIFYDMVGQTGTAVLQGLAGIGGFMVFFISQAWFTAFQKVAWTMLFLEIVRPVKPAQEAEVEAVPEIAT
jgi:hypothetical protein